VAGDQPAKPAVGLGADALRVKPTIGSTLLVVAAIGTAVVVGNVFVAARRTLAWAFATAIVAWLLSAIIELLDRWIPRGAAVLVTVLAVIVVGVGTWVGLIASLRAEANHVQTTLPAAAEKLEQRFEVAKEFRLAARVHDFVAGLDKRFGTSATVSKAAGTAPVYFVTGVLLLFFVGYGPRYLSGALKQIRNPDRRAAVADSLASGSQRARNYLLLTLAQVLVVVALSTLVFYLLGLPGPFGLGLLLGALGAIPNLGMVLGGVPALFLAAANPDEAVIITVVGLIIGLQLVETLGIRRWVDPATVRVGPAAMLTVAIIGFQLYGFGGAAYAGAALVLVLAVLDAGARGKVAIALGPAPDTAAPDTAAVAPEAV
jgi:predicted PurR-regulated permease PerM